MHRAAIGVSVAALLVAATATGCNNAAISRRELVVYFSATSTAQQHRSALQACGDAAPNVTPEPIGTSRYASDRVGDVRFRIDHADDRDLSRLTECLHRQPGVIGFTIPE